MRGPKTNLSRSISRLGIAITLAAFVSGCGSVSLSSSPPSWELKLDMDGKQVTMPLEIMNVYLVEDHQYPEIFEIEGDGVVLVGQFPLDIHVDYEENWKLLIGKEIKISASGGDPRNERNSSIKPPEQKAMKVLGGTFVCEKFSGQYAGRDGDMTLSGKITLRVSTPSGEKTYSGTFAVHCVSWG